MHICVEGFCEHTLLEFSIYEFVGIISIALIAGISSLAGLGGGSPMVAILLVAFNYSPKKTTLLVYVLILGANLGNIINQSTTQIKGKTMIKYRYALVVIPFMFMGSLVGVMFNKFLPSLFICLFIIVTAASSLPKNYQRFRDSYEKETRENNGAAGILHPDIDNEVKRINPFLNEENVVIFKKVALLIGGFVLLQLFRGSERFDSIIGI